MKNTFTLFITALSLCFASTLRANIDVVFDLGGKYPSTGNVNNITTAPTASPFTDYTTGESISGMSFEAAGFYTYLYNSISAWTGSTVDWVDDNIGDDGFMANTNGGTATLTIRGLDASKNYKVELVSIGMNANATPVYITEALKANGNWADRTYNGVTGASLQAWYANSYYSSSMGEDDFLIWDSVAAPDGVLTISLMDISDFSVNTYVNGLRISTVPEPAQCAGAIGAVALLGAQLRRRRKQAA